MYVQEEYVFLEKGEGEKGRKKRELIKSEEEGVKKHQERKKAKSPGTGLEPSTVGNGPCGGSKETHKVVFYDGLSVGKGHSTIP